MNSLTKQQLDLILESTSSSLSDFKVFVETGTYLGETINLMSNYFDSLYTIELSEKLFENFKNSNIKKNITCIHGDSSLELGNLIPKIQNKTIFFLDGHYSSCGTARGGKDVPLYEELKSINDNFIYDALIIIDDLRLFGTSLSENWSDINKESIFNIVEERILQKLEINDRLILKLKNKIRNQT